jgi:integrase
MIPSAIHFEAAPEGSLMAFVRRYSQDRDLREGTTEHLFYTCLSLQKYVDRIVMLKELSAEMINGWIEARLKGGLARKTLHGQRADLVAMWRGAAEMGLAPPVEKVRTLRVPPVIPRAWTADEFHLLLAAAQQTTGSFSCGVRRPTLLKAVLLTGFYTGLRPTDLLSLRTADLTPTGRMLVVQRKTQHPIDVTLPPDCLAAIRATHPEDRELLFPLSRFLLGAWVRILRRKAGCQGSPKWLRRTGATRCEQTQPGSAMAYLGHKTHGLAYKHYVDPLQIESTRPVPPAVDLVQSIDTADKDAPRETIATLAPRDGAAFRERLAALATPCETPEKPFAGDDTWDELATILADFQAEGADLDLSPSARRGRSQYSDCVVMHWGTAADPLPSNRIGAGWSGDGCVWVAFTARPRGDLLRTVIQRP